MSAHQAGAVQLASLAGLAANQIVFGNSSGGASQSSGLTWDDSLKRLVVTGSSAAQQSWRTTGRGMKVVVDEAGGVATFSADTDLNGFAFALRMDLLRVRDYTGSANRLHFDNGVRVDACRFLEAQGADVATANTMTLGTDGNYFVFTGSTTINGIVTAGWQAGSGFRARFTGTPIITNNSGAPGGGAVAILTHTGANFTPAANDIIPFIYDGTNWRIALI